MLGTCINPKVGMYKSPEGPGNTMQVHGSWPELRFLNGSNLYGARIGERHIPCFLGTAL